MSCWILCYTLNKEKQLVNWSIWDYQLFSIQKYALNSLELEMGFNTDIFDQFK